MDNGILGGNSKVLIYINVYCFFMRPEGQSVELECINAFEGLRLEKQMEGKREKGRGCIHLWNQQI